MENKKITAVDNLEQQLKAIGLIPDGSNAVTIMIKEAKEIEKKQIENAFDMGISSVIKEFDMTFSKTDGDEYYKQTYDK